MKDGQTIGQWLKWDFDANGSLAIKDKNCRFIYRELSNGWWAKSEYDSKGNEIYHDDSNGYWVKRLTETIALSPFPYQLHLYDVKFYSHYDHPLFLNYKYPTRLYQTKPHNQ